MLISWDNSLSVGHQEFDDQHKAMIELINKLADTPPESAKDILLEIINTLISHSASHFSCEEKYLSDQLYPDTGAHCIAHQSFINDLKKYHQELTTSAPTHESIQIIANFSATWLIRHIQKPDMAYCDYLHLKDQT